MTTYRFLGTGTTDASGVARLTKDPQGQTINGYTGSGVGEVDFVASLDNPVSSGSIVSGTYSVWDTLFYDSGLDDGTKNPNWTTSGNPSITPTPTGTILSNTSSSIYTSSTTLTGDFEAILYVSDIVRGVRVGLNSSNGSTRSTIYNTGYVKIQRIDNVPKIYFSSDGTNYTETTYDLNTLTSADCNFFFFLYTSSGNEVAIKYKDLKIYSI